MNQPREEQILVNLIHDQLREYDQALRALHQIDDSVFSVNEALSTVEAKQDALYLLLSRYEEAIHAAND